MTEQKEKIAEEMHNFYEKIAKEVGWKTQESTRVLFKDLPEANKTVMLRMAEWHLNALNEERRALCQTINRELKKQGITDTDGGDIVFNYWSDL